MPISLRMSGGVADLGDNRTARPRRVLLALPGATFQFRGRFEDEWGFESRRLDSVS